jgi:hypothetical protein
MNKDILSHEFNAVLEGGKARPQKCQELCRSLKNSILLLYLTPNQRWLIASFILRP